MPELMELTEVERRGPVPWYSYDKGVPAHPAWRNILQWTWRRKTPARVSGSIFFRNPTLSINPIYPAVFVPTEDQSAFLGELQFQCLLFFLFINSLAGTTQWKTTLLIYFYW
jgi:hypothetical protein